MKIDYIYLFLSIIILNIKYIYSFTELTLYANFIPYQSSTCDGESVGIGLSIVVAPNNDNCIHNIGGIGGFQDQPTSFLLFINALRVGIEQYDNIEGAQGKCTGNFTNFYSFKNSTCTPTPPFIVSNGTVLNGLPMNQQYSRFFVSKSPFYGLPDTKNLIFTQYASQPSPTKPPQFNNKKQIKIYNDQQHKLQQCTLPDYLYTMYFTNSLEIQFGQSSSSSSEVEYKSVTYTCDENNQPIENLCKTNNQCNNSTVSLSCVNNQQIYCI